MTARKKRIWYCRHCHTPWDEDYLADLCFKTDMSNLEKYGNENKNIKAITGSKKSKRSR
jgi:hypothetical protein